MKVSNRFWRIILPLPFILLLNACTSDGVHTSGSIQSVYGGYYYPSYGYYGPCCYANYDGPVVIRPEHPDNPERPDRPERPNRPVQPLPGAPSIQPRPRPSTGMGRPSRQMSAPARMPRGGGGRRR